MNWEQWIAANKKEIEHVAGYEEQFVRSILAKIPEIEPEDVIAQYHFTDSSGGNRYIDFMIENKAKGYQLPIELDGYWKVQTYREFDDMLKRQNDLVRIYGLLLRYTNKKMELEPHSIIKEIRDTLHLQKTGQLSPEIIKEQTAKRFEEYQNQLAWYENQLQEQSEIFEAEKALWNQNAIGDKQQSENSSDLITKADIAELKATITALQEKVDKSQNGSGNPDTAQIETNKSSEQKKQPVIKMTQNHMIAIGSVVAIIVAFGANAFFSSSGNQNTAIEATALADTSSVMNEADEYQNQSVKPTNASHQNIARDNDNIEPIAQQKEVLNPIEPSTTKEAVVETVAKEHDAGEIVVSDLDYDSSSYEEAIANTVPASQSYKHIGSYRVVCGTVVQIKAFSKGMYLNLGASYPNQDATIVVWNSDAGNVGDIDRYQGQDICLKGTIDSYKGTPQIKLASSSQIQ